MLYWFDRLTRDVIKRLVVLGDIFLFIQQKGRFYVRMNNEKLIEIRKGLFAEELGMEHKYLAKPFQIGDRGSLR